MGMRGMSDKSGRITLEEVIRERERRTRGRPRLEYKWSALSCTSLGALIATINGGTLIIALPELARELHAPLFSLVWVILGYMLAQTALVLMVGRFADMIGRKKLYVGGFMMANSGVIVTDAFPHRQLGQALGVNQMVAAVGSILGPVVGGWLTTYSWQWVFWFNVPLGLVGTLWAAWNLRELVEVEKGQRMDLPGNASFLVGFTALLIGLTQGGIKGWGSGIVLASLVTAAVLIPAFVLVELKSKDPLLNLRMFRSRVFAFGNVSALLNSLARMAVTFLFVFYFIGARGYDHLTTGLLLTPLAGSMFVFAPLAGRLADRLPARVLSSTGMLITAGGLLGMTSIGVQTPYWKIALWMFVVGAGSGIFNSPNTRAIMGSVTPEKRGVASGTRTLVVNVGAVLSIAFAIAMVTSVMPVSAMVEIFSGVSQGLSASAAAPFISGLHAALLLMAVVSIVGFFFSALRGREHG